MNIFYLNSELELLMIFLLFSLTYIMCFMLMVKNINRKRYRQTNNFINALAIGFKEGTIESVQDINNTYKGIFNVSCDTNDSIYCGRLCKLLRKFLIKVIQNNGAVRDQELSYEDRIKIKEKLTKFIEHFENTYPYANLPLAEMNIMNDISSYISNNDVSSIKRKILELSEVLQVRAEDFHKLENYNKWSVPIAIFGVVLTIAFGVMQLLQIHQ